MLSHFCTCAVRRSDKAQAVQAPPDWQEILTYHRGSELQNYSTRILEDIKT